MTKAELVKLLKPFRDDVQVDIYCDRTDTLRPIEEVKVTQSDYPSKTGERLVCLVHG